MHTRRHTEVPELQDVEGPKSMAAPPTAQTPGPNWLNFWGEAPQEDRGGFFNFVPESILLRGFLKKF